MPQQRIRLDQLLVERGQFASRSRALDAIKRGKVRINGIKAEKPGQRVAHNCGIEVSDHAAAYVSRSALKLVAALERFHVDVKGKIAADIGASTGGFTQVLIDQGAECVYAVDVGHNQFAPSLQNHPHIFLLEGVNARDLSQEHIPHALDVIVCDVSFISLKLALPGPMALAGLNADLIALIKPQFEVGRKGVGKGGIVRSESLRAVVCAEISQWLEGEMNWQVRGLICSPITGGDGNQEFLVHAQRSN